MRDTLHESKNEVVLMRGNVLLIGNIQDGYNGLHEYCVIRNELKCTKPVIMICIASCWKKQ